MARAARILVAGSIGQEDLGRNRKTNSHVPERLQNASCVSRPDMCIRATHGV